MYIISIVHNINLFILLKNIISGCGEGFEGKYWDAKTCNMCTKTFNDKNQVFKIFPIF